MIRDHLSADHLQRDEAGDTRQKAEAVIAAGLWISSANLSHQNIRNGSSVGGNAEPLVLVRTINSRG